MGPQINFSNGLMAVAIMACFTISSIYCEETAKTAEKRSLCSLRTAKRMMDTLGIAAEEEGCILKNKRDIANLVGSYMEGEVDRIKTFDEKRDILSEIEEMFDIQKRGNYCCSPKCDKFMQRMGNPSPATVKCKGKK